MAAVGAAGIDTSLIAGAAVGVVAVIVGLYLFTSKKSMGGGSSSSRSSGNKMADGSDAGASSADKYPAGRLNVYFGSQTGTAEGFARVLMEEGRSRGFDAKMCDLDEFKPAELKGPSIFLMATYGEGEPTDNAARFAKWLGVGPPGSAPDAKSVAATNRDAEAAPENSLQGVPFTVFGLGNKQYEHFNAMGKATNAHLERLGGKRVHTYGEGDDDNALEDDFEAWKGGMWESLVAQFHPGKGRADSFEGTATEVAPSRHFAIQILDTAAEAKARKAGVPLANVAASTRHFFTCKTAAISVNRELRENNLKSKDSSNAGPAGSTRHIEIDLVGTGLSYQTADNLAILPENDPTVVQALVSKLELGSGAFTIAPVDGTEFKYSFPVPCTPAGALTSYFDIRGEPSLGMLKALLPFVADDAQKKWLGDMLDKNNRSKLKTYIEAHRCSFATLVLPELGGELSSLRVSLCDLLHILPAIQPRYYTISSSSSCFPDTVHITVSVTEAVTVTGRAFKGLTSAHLTMPPPSCRVYVRPSSFRLPQQLSTPIVMIGPGTGLAPMRALLQERRFQSKNAGPATRSSSGAGASGSNTLFFGCRHPNVDYIYKDELSGFQQDGTLTSLHTAFSRQQKDKVYVQHLLSVKANASALLADLDNGGYVYVCGATRMGNDVMEAIVSVLAARPGGSKDKAQAEVKELQRAGRYVQELWSTE